MKTEIDLKELVVGLAGLMSVSGRETHERRKLLSLVGGYFDEYYADDVGNQVFVRYCGRENAPKILIDTHFDEVGMYIADIKEGGFLSFVNIGGLDTRILGAAEVIIYGDRQIYGVIASTPPHLQKPKDAEKPGEIYEFLIDTGYTKEELESFVRVGTPVGFLPKYTDLVGGSIAGKSFDDKACAACAVYAIAGVPKDELCGDVYLLLSAFEETRRVGGAAAGTYRVEPDYAMVVDVCHARVPDTSRGETTAFGGGPAITHSPATDRRLTKMTAELAGEKGIKYQFTVSSPGTGTNSPAVGLARAGVPVVDVGLPMKNMHTYNEIICIEDCIETSKLISAFVSSGRIAGEFRHEKI